MSDIARIRTLIAAGKSDADIAEHLQREARKADNFGTDDPGRTFGALARTMHRAVRDDRPVAAKEALVLLDFFRRFWEEIAARGDVPSVESAVVTRLAKVVSAPTVGKAYERLHEDMLQLSKPAKGLNPGQKRARAEVESRYLRQVGQHSVICCAKVASAVADVCEVLYQVLSEQTHYEELFSRAVFQPAMPLLLVHRPTWREILAEAQAEHTLPTL